MQLGLLMHVYHLVGPTFALHTYTCQHNIERFKTFLFHGCHKCVTDNPCMLYLSHTPFDLQKRGISRNNMSETILAEDQFVCGGE